MTKIKFIAIIGIVLGIFIFIIAKYSEENNHFNKNVKYYAKNIENALNELFKETGKFDLNNLYDLNGNRIVLGTGEAGVEKIVLVLHQKIKVKINFNVYGPYLASSTPGYEVYRPQNSIYIGYRIEINSKTKKGVVSAVRKEEDIGIFNN